MIISIVMRTKQAGFTIIEFLVSTGIAVVVIASALGVVGNIYFEQKQIELTQDFYNESRIVLERIAQIARNNTLDYDRYWDTQTLNNGDGADVWTDNTCRDRFLLLNPPVAEADLEYEDIFYWDTNGDNELDRNLGGRDINGIIDPCNVAWTDAQNNLFLINAARNLRTAVRPNGNGIEVERQLGADTDNDGKVDLWGNVDANDDGDFDDFDQGDAQVVWDSANNQCEIHFDLDTSGVLDVDEEFAILGDSTNEDLCFRAHGFATITPASIVVNNVAFEPSPNRDPFLNYRIDNAQVHPHVFVALQTELEDAVNKGYSPGTEPTLSLQSTVSSRVFGNTR